MIFVLSYTMVHSNNQSKQAHYNQYHLKNCIFYIPSTTHLIITHTYNYVINILQVFIQKHIIERPSNITRATIPKTNIPKTNISIYYDIILYVYYKFISQDSHIGRHSTNYKIPILFFFFFFYTTPDLDYKSKNCSDGN